MSLSKKDIAGLRQSVKTGEIIGSDPVDATTTVSVVHFGRPSEKVSFQADTTLTGTVEFSINGKTWVSSTAIGTSGAIVTFTTHAVSAARVTRTGGAGIVAFAVI